MIAEPHVIDPVLDDTFLPFSFLVEGFRRGVHVDPALIRLDVNDLGEVPDIKVKEDFTLPVVDVRRGHPVVQEGSLPFVVVSVVDLPRALPPDVDEDVFPDSGDFQVSVLLEFLEERRGLHRDDELPFRLLGGLMKGVDAVCVVPPEGRECELLAPAQDLHRLLEDCLLAQVLPDILRRHPRPLSGEERGACLQGFAGELVGHRAEGAMEAEVAGVRERAVGGVYHEPIRPWNRVVDVNRDDLEGTNPQPVASPEGLDDMVVEGRVG